MRHPTGDRDRDPLRVDVRPYHVASVCLQELCGELSDDAEPDDAHTLAE